MNKKREPPKGATVSHLFVKIQTSIIESMSIHTVTKNKTSAKFIAGLERILEIAEGNNILSTFQSGIFRNYDRCRRRLNRPTFCYDIPHKMIYIDF